MKKIALVTTSPFIVNAFLLGHLRTLSLDYQVHLIVNCKEEGMALDPGLQVHVHHIPIRRKLALLPDLMALFTLIRILNVEHYDAVHSMAPKAGLIAMTSAWLLRVPVRIHMFTGQIWVTRGTFLRFLFKTIDRCIAWMATDVLVDSHSQRDVLVAQDVIASGKVKVLEHGSVSGVDVSRFIPSKEARHRVREELGVPLDARIILYVGRLSRDKGLLDLASAFLSLASDVRHGMCHLLIVGPDEEGLGPRMRDICKSVAGRVHFVGYTKYPESYMAASDILVLPSYREGFGSVLIEAGAVGLPVVATRIYGVIDAVVGDVTGLLYLPHDEIGLAAALERLLLDEELRVRMGRAARERAVRDFSAERMCAAMRAFYRSRMRAA